MTGTGVSGLTNEVYWGIDVQPQQYTGSFYVKGPYDGNFTASLESATSGQALASVTIPSTSNQNGWVQYQFILTPTTMASNTNNTFSLTFDASVISCPECSFIEY